MNIFSIITIVVVAFGTGYSIFLVNKNKEKLTCMSGMMIAMAVAMMTGLLSGYLIGILTGDMFLSGGVSIIIGFFIGFLTGQPIGIMAILDGALSGLMSGAMGAMLGVMVMSENPFIMLGILLGLYIIICGLVILFIKVETDTKLTINTQAISPFAIFAAGVILVSLFLFLYSSPYINIPSKETTTQAQSNEDSGNTNSSITEQDLTKDPSPKINMEATPSGYSPNIIYVKKGAPVELNIHNTLENSCISTFNLPPFNIHNVNLKVGTTTFTFTPNKIGEYTFSCGMNMFKGKIVVVE